MKIDKMKNYIKGLDQKQKTLFLLGVLALLALPLIFMSSSVNKGEYRAGDSIREHARTFVDNCKDVDVETACYINEVIKLMEVASMEETFDVIRMGQQEDERLLVCHTIGHVVGETEVKKDPDKWVEVISRCPDFTCSDGCPHGAVIGKFDTDNLSEDEIEQAKADLANACGYDGNEENLTPPMYKCIHGVGHLFMFLANADIEESLRLCKTIEDNTQAAAYSACSEGVFMIMYQPLGPDQEDLVRGLAPTVDTIDEFCTQYEGVDMESCYNEGFVTLQGGVLNQEIVEDHCDYSDDPVVVETCLEVLHMVAAKHHIVSDILRLSDYVDYCNDASTDEIKENCIQSGVIKILQQDVLFVDKVLEICELSDGIGLREHCLDVLAGYFPRTFLPGNHNEGDVYCSALPEGWVDTCMQSIDQEANNQPG